MMQQMIQTAVRLVYPPRCLGCGDLVDSDFGLCATCWRDTPFIGGTTCAACGIPLQGPDDGHRIECDDCIATPRPWRDGRAALMYRDRARRIVLGLKHGDRADLVQSAADWMARAGADILQPGCVLVPVPLHWLRLARRRYNQSALLAQALARRTGLIACPDLLQRVRRTPSQDGRTATQRAENLTGAIRVHPRRAEMARGASVVLVDDVMTSGATLSACTDACIAAGANRVDVLVLARVGKDD